EKAVPPAPHRLLRHPGPADRLHQTEARVEPRDDARPPGVLPEAPRVARDLFEALALPVRKPDFPSCRFPARLPLSRFVGRSKRRREDNVTLPEEMEYHVSNRALGTFGTSDFSASPIPGVMTLVRDAEPG
ncbi:MAG: hypothetical protein OXC66_03745, partial [Roseovarius sp.]|nr:hypothetical protein [Roseovarius sp.]